MNIESLTVPDMLAMIDEPNRGRCTYLWEENYQLLLCAPGSSHNHQAWPGGYVDHIRDVMTIGIMEYRVLNKFRPLPFSLSDLLLILFLHDLEKPWKYNLFLREGEGARKSWGGKKANHEFRLKKISEYGIVLTEYQLDALKYVEGEGDDYTNTYRVMNELAAVAHICDVASARLWYDFPKKEERVNKQ